MAFERWGSLSVADHKDIHVLIHNVLLYDRLVFPMFTESEDRDEREYWDAHDWNPDLQLNRRNQLGDLAIECAWDKLRRESYKNRYRAASQINEEVNGEMVTRWLLTEDQDYQLPNGVYHADVFVAYNSEESMQVEIPSTKIEPYTLNDESQVGIMIGHVLGIPDIKEPEVALGEAINLSKDPDFRIKRANLYEFQMNCLKRGIAPHAIVSELRDRNRDLINYIKKQKVPIRKKTGFMLAKTMLGAIGGAFINPVSAISEIISVWKFVNMEMDPNIQAPYHLQPVAAFHDIEEKIGLEF
jgi:hypothetical protein